MNRNTLKLIHVQNAMNNTCHLEKISTSHYSNVSAYHGKSKAEQYAHQIQYGRRTTRTVYREVMESVQPPKNKFI